MIIQLAERIVALPPEEHILIGPNLRDILMHPKILPVSVEGADLGPQGGAGAGSSKTREKKTEKTAFDVKLEKFDAAVKSKVVKEVRAFTNLGLKEAKDLVEKVPVLLKHGVTKEEAKDIEQIKSAGGSCCDRVNLHTKFCLHPIFLRFLLPIVHMVDQSITAI
ncbi:hypothetical protein ACH5RR_009299 [Cinchona calisaya]|uniref:Large ribosomal subunit protein bL12 C-terminal domain-containing protein n=1 Tax=Cinchona calisaya TaxID=153742 RepID=A0ABD3AE12_9GENT